jgi:hypothetical protein
MPANGDVGIYLNMAAAKHLFYLISILLALLLFSARVLAQESVWYGRCVGPWTDWIRRYCAERS